MNIIINNLPALAPLMSQEAKFECEKKNSLRICWKQFVSAKKKRGEKVLFIRTLARLNSLELGQFVSLIKFQKSCSP